MSVATQTISVTDLRRYAFTMDMYKKQVIASEFSHSPALAIFANQTLGDFGGTKLSGRGHSTETGGVEVRRRVTLGVHAGAARMVGPTGTHNVSQDDNTRLSRGNYKYYSHAAVIDIQDRMSNRGDSAISSFLEHQLRSVVRATGNLIAGDIFSTISPSTAITSLASLVSTNDSVHELSGATYDNWNSRGISDRGTAAGSISFTPGATSFAAAGLATLRTAWNNGSEGMVQPDVNLVSYGNIERYDATLLPQARFEGPAQTTADAAFMAHTYHGRPVFADPNAADGDWFMVSLDKIEGVQLHVQSGADFDFDDWKPSATQFVYVRPLVVMCELMIGNRRFGSNKVTGFTD